MGANLTKVIVIDLEATCWETAEEQGQLPNEIIEIGICELHLKTGVISHKRSYPVLPQFSQVSEFCTKLTGWTQEQIDDSGKNILDVIQDVGDDYGLTQNHVWFSFGEYDRIKLSSTPGTPGSLHALYGIERKQNPIAMMRSHLNVKTLMALKEKLKRELGMDRALQFYGETLEGRHHNGADDAYNIAKIVRRVLS